MHSDLLAHIEQGIAATEMRITCLLWTAAGNVPALAVLEHETVAAMRKNLETQRYLRGVVLEMLRKPPPRHPGMPGLRD
jgi:hypothetical protein